MKRFTFKKQLHLRQYLDTLSSSILPSLKQTEMLARKNKFATVFFTLNSRDVYPGSFPFCVSFLHLVTVTDILAPSISSAQHQ